MTKKDYEQFARMFKDFNPEDHPKPKGAVMETYKIIRRYFRSDVPARTIKRGLTLEEAQAHCQDPQTSSSTCTDSAGRRHTRKYGPWFDGYSAEE